MGKIKVFIFWGVIGVAGYFAYQYFIGNSQQGSITANQSFNMYSLPEKCQEAGKFLENAFHQHKKGEIVTAQVNSYKSHFRGCLRREGYTAPEIEAAYNGIAYSADYNR